MSEMHPIYISLLIILVSIGAGFVQRVSGFGLGIFAMIFLPYFLPSATAAAAIVGICSMVTSSMNAVKYRKDIKFKTVLPMLVAALLSTTVAVIFSSKVPKSVFEILLGAVLVVLSIYFLFFGSSVKIRPSAVNGVISGTLSGVLNGLFSTGGPPAVVYLTEVSASNAAYFAGIQFFFAASNIYATAMRAVSGILTLDILDLSVFGLLGCVAGDFIGKFVFDKLDGNKLRKIIYIGMVISGVVMIL